MEIQTTESAETHLCAAQKGLRKKGYTQFSRKSPHSKYQYMEGGRWSARCPKVSFVLHSVPRERGLPCVQWLKTLPASAVSPYLWYNTRRGEARFQPFRAAVLLSYVDCCGARGDSFATSRRKDKADAYRDRRSRKGWAFGASPSQRGCYAF